MDLPQPGSDVSYTSSDESEQNFRQPNINMFPDLNQEVNETADSFRQFFNPNDEEDDSYYEIAQAFSEYYRDSLKRAKIQNVEKFQNHKLFESYSNCMEVYPPRPNLYFLPTVILIGKKIDKTILSLRDSIVKNYGSNANVQIPKQKPNEILVTIHTQKYMMPYIIRSINLSIKDQLAYPELLDQDLSLNPLFEFYEKNYEDRRFSQTCGIFLYWAYIKKLLGPDYLPETALKIIVIFFYIITQRALNIPIHFMSAKSEELNKLTKMFTVNKNLQCELDSSLFNYSNFSLREKRSFYSQKQRKYTSLIQILPVPYPVNDKDIKHFSQKCRQNKNLQRNLPQVYPVLKFFKIIQFFENCIKRSERVIFDFSNKKGINAQPEIDFNIEVNHPIFGNNICEKLTKDGSKLRILKQEISNVMRIYKRDREQPVKALSTIFQK